MTARCALDKPVRGRHTEDMTTAPLRPLFGHTSPETAYVVEDYPYGFRLRTTIRYWIETTKHGDRFVSQTKNPKTGRWNKPKASTYSGLAVLALNDEGHVTHTGITEYTSEAYIETFRELTAGRLSEPQAARLAQIIGYQRVMKHVKFEVRETTHQTPEERAADDAKQAAIRTTIAKGMVYETRRAAAELAQ